MLIFSQNGLWSVPNKQNPSFYSIFHAFPRSKFLPVCPFPIENTHSPLLSLILSYRNIPILNSSILDLFLPPLIRIGSDQHGTHVGPTWVQHGSISEQHGSNMVPKVPTWFQHGSNMVPTCGSQGTIVARVPKGPLWPGTPSKREMELFPRTLPLKNDLKKSKNTKNIRNKILYRTPYLKNRDLFSRVNFEYFRFPSKTSKLLENGRNT